MDLEYGSELKLQFPPEGLLPVVTQDVETRDVLILSWVNREALEASLAERRAVYWSRSRKALWRKGETSGDVLELVEVRVNCEQNSLLFLVRMKGRGACHAKKADGGPHHGCFYRKIEGNALVNLEA